MKERKQERQRKREKERKSERQRDEKQRIKGNYKQLALPFSVNTHCAKKEHHYSADQAYLLVIPFINSKFYKPKNDK